jgi:uncharacterized phage protein gp47/JayE
MALSTQSFTQTVSNAVAAIQGAATQLVDVTTGSILLAATQAASAIGMWLQGLALQIAALTRFATSNGTDADSWGADFGFYRIGAKQATGQVTFARFTDTNTASIPLGAVVQTADGTQSYTVIADTTESAYNSGTSTYVIPGGTPSATVTVQSVNAAAAANVSAGVISVLGSAIPYVDTVNNAAAFENGADAEADPSFRARFVTYLASLARATKAAIISALQALSTAINFTLTENQSYSGAYQPGYFYSVVDDGTGYPSSAYLNAAYLAIDAVRPFTSTFGVFAPAVVVANVALTVTSASGYTHSVVTAAVDAALVAYLNTLATGTSLPLTRVASVAYGVSGVSNVTGITINTVAADLVVTANQIVKAGTVVAA